MPSPVAPSWGAGGWLQASNKSATGGANHAHSSSNHNISNSSSNSSSNSRCNSSTSAVGGGSNAHASPTEGMRYLPHPTAAIASSRNYAWEVKAHLPNDSNNHAFNTAARGRAHVQASEALHNFAVAMSSRWTSDSPNNASGSSSSTDNGGGDATYLPGIRASAFS